MPKRLNTHQTARHALHRRQFALERNELRQASEPREAPTSPTSFPVKKTDMDIRALIDAALKAREQS